MDVDALVEQLRADDWSAAARVACELKAAPGPVVTRALLDALDARDTAVSEAATEALIPRDEPGTVEGLVTVLAKLDDDVADHVWDVIRYRLPDERVSREVARRLDLPG